MAKLRKMLGDINSPVCVSLMALIATQSQHTLDKWALDVACERYLPIYEALCPGDTALRDTAAMCRSYIAGEIKLGALKPLLSEARKLASGIKGDVEQAAARAVSTAFAVVQTPTNAFGFLMYGAAATAYHRAGLDRTQAEYDALAEEELEAVLKSLESIAVKGEKNPAKINWNC